METNNKLREALEATNKFLESAITGGKVTARDITALRDIVSAARSEPVRNCDVGTPKQQAKRFQKFCLGHQPKEGDCTCACPAFVGKDVDCHFSWAKMPYEEGVQNAE